MPKSLKGLSDQIEIPKIIVAMPFKNSSQFQLDFGRNPNAKNTSNAPSIKMAIPNINVRGKTEPMMSFKSRILTAIWRILRMTFSQRVRAYRVCIVKLIRSMPATRKVQESTTVIDCKATLGEAIARIPRMLGRATIARIPRIIRRIPKAIDHPRAFLKS